MQTMKKLLRLLVGLTSALSLQACSSSYSAKAIEAWVVDAETKKPLEGVIVVAHWELAYGIEGGGAYPLHVMETVTDKSGRFYFPAWGPKEIPAHLPREARLKNQDPGFGIFHPSYKSVSLWTERPIAAGSGHGESERGSVWNGKTIEMKPINTVRERAFSLSNLESEFHFLRAQRTCEWIHMPRMIVALNAEMESLKKLKDASLPGLNFTPVADFYLQANCGSAADVFRGLSK